jgi:hypothetical protein
MTIAPHFQDALWHELESLHQQPRYEGRRPSPSPSQRRPGRRSLLVGAASVAATTVLIAALIALQDGGYDPDGTDADLVTDVVAATQSAAAGSVVHVTTDNSEMWRDQTTGSMRVRSGETALGHPVAPPAPGDDTVVSRTVVHCDQTYSERDIPLLPAHGDEALSIEGVLDFGTDDLVGDGTETVDGRDLVRLRLVSDEVDHVFLVDPTTHLPVQERITTAEGTTVGRYEYLPRTPANLAAAAAPPVPAGYTQVPPGTSTC